MPPKVIEGNSHTTHNEFGYPLDCLINLHNLSSLYES